MYFSSNIVSDVLNMRLSTCRDQWSSRNYSTLSILFLLFCGKTCSVISEIIYVKRLAGRDDRFGPVSKHLGTSISDYCITKYQGAAIGSGKTDCTCLPSEGTYLYHNDTCVQKTIITELIKRKKADCKDILNENEILDLKNASEEELGTDAKKVKKVYGKCIINQTNYIYDSKKSLTLIQSGFSGIFSINAREKELRWGKVPASSSLHGRIIVLETRNCTIKFESNDKIHSPCIVFKAEGTIFYNSSATASTAASTTQSDTTSLYSTVSSAVPTTEQSEKNTAATSNPSAKSPTGAAEGKDGEGRSDKQSAPIGLIVGLVVGALVIIAIIILIFVWRRRSTRSDRKNHKLENGQKHSTHSDNPVYGRQETINLSNQSQASRNTANEVDDADYAAIDSDPRASNGAAQGIYQSLIKDPNRQSVYAPLERNDSSVEQSYGYNELDRQPFKPVRNGPSDPAYNVLERPSEQKCPATGNNLVTNKKPLSKQTLPIDEPVYNVLEDPNPEGEDEPEYNVLESPEGQDDPDYNVLEDPDDNYDNALVEGDMGHPSSHDNVGYGSTIDVKPKHGVQNEPVYEAPEGPSSESTYQPLDVNAQDGTVYQPLDRTSRVIPDNQPVYQVLEQNNT